MAVINPVSRPTVSSLSLQAWTSEHSQHLLSRRVPIQYYIQYTLCCTSLVDVECQLTRDPFPFLPVTLPKKTGKREMAPARYCCCCRELCNSSRGSSTVYRCVYSADGVNKYIYSIQFLEIYKEELLLFLMVDQSIDDMSAAALIYHQRAKGRRHHAESYRDDDDDDSFSSGRKKDARCGVLLLRRQRGDATTPRVNTRPTQQERLDETDGSLLGDNKGGMKPKKKKGIKCAAGQHHQNKTYKLFSYIFIREVWPNT